MTLDFGDFDTFEAIYVLKIKVKNESPLSITSGKSLTGGVDNPVIRRDGEPYIPGSSLKGVFRVLAEQYARKVYGANDPSIVCDILNPKGPHGELKRKEDAEKSKDERSPYKPCLICRVFGGPTIGSHITFYDSIAEEYTIETRTCVALSRVTGAQYHGHLYDVEYLTPGSMFELKIEIENIDLLNPDKDETRILNYLFKRLILLGINLGSRTSIGMGKIRVPVDPESISMTELKKYITVTKLFLNENYEIATEDVTEKYLQKLGLVGDNK